MKYRLTKGIHFTKQGQCVRKGDVFEPTQAEVAFLKKRIEPVTFKDAVKKDHRAEVRQTLNIPKLGTVQIEEETKIQKPKKVPKVKKTKKTKTGISKVKKNKAQNVEQQHKPSNSLSSLKYLGSGRYEMPNGTKHRKHYLLSNGWVE